MFFEPSELPRKAWKTFKLDKVDWLFGNDHTTKGVAEGTANAFNECGQTFQDRMEMVERAFYQMLIIKKIITFKCIKYALVEGEAFYGVLIN